MSGTKLLLLLLLLLQSDRQLQAVRDAVEENESEAQHIFERLRDNTLLIRAALVEGISSANPDVSTAFVNILGGVADTLGDAARAIYLHIHDGGYAKLCHGERRCPLRLAPKLVRIHMAWCDARRRRPVDWQAGPFSHVCAGQETNPIPCLVHLESRGPWRQYTRDWTGTWPTSIASSVWRPGGWSRVALPAMPS